MNRNRVTSIIKSFAGLLYDIHVLAGPNKLILYAAAVSGFLIALMEGVMTVLAVDFVFMLVGSGKGFGLASTIFAWIDLQTTAQLDQRIIVLWLLLSSGALTVVIRGVGQSVNVVAATRIITHARLAIIDTILRANFAYLDQVKTGWIRQIVASNVEGLVRIIQAIMRLLASLVTVIVLVGILASLSVKLSLIVVACGVFFIPVKLLLARLIHRLSRISAAARLDLMQQINETLSGIRQIKLQNRQKQFRNRIWKTSADAETNDRNAQLVDLWEPLLIQILLFVLIGVLVTVFSGNDKASTAVLLSFLLVLYRVTGPVVTVSHIFNGVMKKLPNVRYVTDLFRLGAGELEDSAGTVKPIVSVDTVALESVAHSYGDGERVLEDVSIKANKGEFVAIVGASGAGKSSLVHLLLRMYEPDSGRITLDGTDIRNINPDNLRDAIGLVSQDIHLFDLSVRDLIGGDRKDLASEDIVTAARAAQADEFIRALPDGYATVIGEDGTALSGGQRQRLFIAQILARNTPVVIFDEATNALDVSTEEGILRDLRELCTDKILIVITHRIDMVRNANRIYVLEEGRITESGSWDALMAQRGALWKLSRRRDGPDEITAERAAAKELAS